MVYSSGFMMEQDGVFVENMAKILLMSCFCSAVAKVLCKTQQTLDSFLTCYEFIYTGAFVKSIRLSGKICSAFFPQKMYCNGFGLIIFVVINALHVFTLTYDYLSYF